MFGLSDFAALPAMIENPCPAALQGADALGTDVCLAHRDGAIRRIPDQCPTRHRKCGGRRTPAAFISCCRRFYCGPPPVAPSSAFCDCMAFSSAWSTEKLEGFCLGGKSLNVFRNSPTIACAGMNTNMRSAAHF